MTHYWGWMYDEDIEAFLELGDRVSLAFWCAQHLNPRAAYDTR
jgi:hypothetical protein